jgi:hypothetical protein
MPDLQVRVPAGVEQVLPLLLAHVVVVGLPCRPDRRPPVVRPDLVGAGGADGVADLVVVLDRVLDLLAHVPSAVPSPTDRRGG